MHAPLKRGDACALARRSELLPKEIVSVRIVIGKSKLHIQDMIDSGTTATIQSISKIIGLDICGIDVMTSDISVPVEEAGGAVLEVNA